jgi:flavin-dependent dehydrogenase
MTRADVDVIVIGGGPAGSTAANLLSQAGHSVRVLEREAFPRFHIGESLLPCSMPTLARLGVKVEGEFVVKHGAEFIDERSGAFAFFGFSDALPGGPPRALQVERSCFDAALLEQAQRRGAQVCFGETARGYTCDAEGVQVATDSGSHRARYLIDASGQRALLATTAHTRESLTGFGKVAVFTHFSELPAAAQALFAQGNIKVFMVDEGWAWLIPLAGGTLSVGVVTRRTPVDRKLLDDFVASSPLVAALTAGAQASEPRVIGNYAFRNRRRHGARYACVGDAACFLDPVFSSGVALALHGAERMADTLTLALAAGSEADPELMAPVAAHMDRAYDCVGSLIHSFYHTRIVDNLFFAPRPVPELRAGLISLLAGDLWRDDNRFRDMLAASKRRATHD